MDASTNEADTPSGESAKNQLPKVLEKNKGRTIILSNSSGKNPTVVIDPFQGELISCEDGEVDFSFEDFESAFAGAAYPVGVGVDDSATTDSVKYLRLTSHRDPTFTEEIEWFKEFLDSKTDEKFTDLNQLIAYTLEFLTAKKGGFGRPEFPDTMSFYTRKHPNRGVVINPYLYFSATQFQDCIIDINDAQKLNISVSHVKFRMPKYCILRFTIFT